MNEKQMQMVEELIKQLKATHAYNVMKYLDNGACTTSGAEAEAAVLAAAMASCVNETVTHVIAKLNDIVDAK
jgi:hypothetical protein